MELTEAMTEAMIDRLLEEEGVALGPPVKEDLWASNVCLGAPDDPPVTARAKGEDLWA